MTGTLQRATAALCAVLLVLPGGAFAAEQIVELSSSGRETKHSLPPNTQEVELLVQRTGACRFGRTWGYDLAARDLWVNGGCGGQFKITTREPASAAPDSSNTAAALAAAAAIAGVAILASKGRHDNHDNAQTYYPNANQPGYYPPQAGYYPPQPGQYPQGGGRRGTIHGPNNLCLDMRGDRVNQGTEAIVYNCHGKQNQTFNWSPRGELIVANMCLDVADGNSANGARVIAWPCNGGRNQQWFVRGTQIQSGLNGKCLDVAGGKMQPGTPVIVYDCHGGPNQRWFW
jgi:hypothetical protein